MLNVKGYDNNGSQTKKCYSYKNVVLICDEDVSHDATRPCANRY